MVHSTSTEGTSQISLIQVQFSQTSPKKDAKWVWGALQQEKFQELRHKLAHHIAIGVPRPHGEIVLVSDGSDVGGGSTIFQWQTLEKEQIPIKFQTMGVKNDGKLKHTYPENYRLVSLGHWNRKWNPARSKYSTYEQELLGGVLTIQVTTAFCQICP